MTVDYNHTCIVVIRTLFIYLQSMKHVFKAAHLFVSQELTDISALERHELS